MFDALEELSDLSLALQKADANLPVAQRLISRQVELFSFRRSSGWVHYDDACKAVDAGKFHNITISQVCGKEKEIHIGQFYKCLCDSMSARMFPDPEKDLCNAVSVLDKST